MASQIPLYIQTPAWNGRLIITDSLLCLWGKEGLTFSLISTTDSPTPVNTDHFLRPPPPATRVQTSFSRYLVFLCAVCYYYPKFFSRLASIVGKTNFSTWRSQFRKRCFSTCWKKEPRYVWMFNRWKQLIIFCYSLV